MYALLENYGEPGSSPVWRVVEIGYDEHNMLYAESIAERDENLALMRGPNAQVWIDNVLHDAGPA